uniref:CUB domain-containing protein n=1 Tax=Macrostomum lignano TaxID=282301 RepID=A0A1I8FTW9_9PLAT
MRRSAPNHPAAWSRLAATPSSLLLSFVSARRTKWPPEQRESPEQRPRPDFPLCAACSILRTARPDRERAPDAQQWQPCANRKSGAAAAGSRCTARKPLWKLAQSPQSPQTQLALKAQREATGGQAARAGTAGDSGAKAAPPRPSASVATRARQLAALLEEKMKREAEIETKRLNEHFLVFGVLAGILSLVAAAGAGTNKPPPASCGTPVISQTSGELLSHSTYAKCEYPRNFKCEWNIKGLTDVPSSRIEFSFAAYEMPRDKPPCDDTHLKFFSGDALDKTLCNGREIPEKFVSSGENVRVVFKSTTDPKGITAKGFHMKWRFVRECQPDDFICKNKECIPKAFQCDGGTGLALRDCVDESDEENCKELSSCPDPKGKLCKNKMKCFTMEQECDGVEDCRDGTDESDCKDVECDASKGLARCKHKKRCYNKKQQECNGVKDCRDNSDEEHCVVQTCTKDQFRCDHKFACVPKNYTCDGVADCNDNSDEKGCKVLESCSNPGEVLCGHKFACVAAKKSATATKTATDGSDESKQLRRVTCSATQFKCRTAQCVENSQRCDMKSDCFDNLDEQDCPYKTGQGPPCGLNHIWCRTAKKCVRSSTACNGVDDLRRRRHFGRGELCQQTRGGLR